MIPTNLGISWSQGWCSIISWGRTFRDRGDTDIHCTSRRYCTYFGDVWSEFHDFMNGQIFWTKKPLGHLGSLGRFFSRPFYPNSDLEIWREDGHFQRDHKAIQSLESSQLRWTALLGIVGICWYGKTISRAEHSRVMIVMNFRLYEFWGAWYPSLLCCRGRITGIHFLELQKRPKSLRSLLDHKEVWCHQPQLWQLALQSFADEWVMISHDWH